MNCPHCGLWILESVGRLRARRKEKGLCIQCGKKPSGVYVRCEDCRRKANEARKLACMPLPTIEEASGVFGNVRALGHDRDD